MEIRIQYLKYLIFLNLFFISNELDSQPISKDTLCKYVENLSDSNLIYSKNPKDIPKKIFRYIKKIENNRIKIVSAENMNFSDVTVSDKKSGLIYFAHYANYYYLMLKQGGFVATYILKIFIEENSKIIAIRNFDMTYPYYLNEFVHLKWGCEFYTTK